MHTAHGGGPKRTKRSDRQVQARSIATREKLIATSLDTVHELGLKRAAIPKFARRAGVSRGALLHHFHTCEDIVVAAIETLLKEATYRIRRVAADMGREELDC